MGKLLISNTNPRLLIMGSRDDPKDVIVQNVSANNVYLSFETIDAVAQNGIKLTAGASYSNDALITTLYALADVDASEIRIEIQPSMRWFRR